MVSESAQKRSATQAPRYHDEFADLYRVRELIELRSEVPAPVPPPVRHQLHKMFQDGVTVGQEP